jgi:hypothetical protein
MDEHDKTNKLNPTEEAEYKDGFAAGESDGFDAGVEDGFNCIEVPLPDDEGSSEVISINDTPSLYTLGYNAGLPYGYNRGFKAGRAKRDS